MLLGLLLPQCKFKVYLLPLCWYLRLSMAWYLRVDGVAFDADQHVLVLEEVVGLLEVLDGVFDLRG